MYLCSFRQLNLAIININNLQLFACYELYLYICAG